MGDHADQFEWTENHVCNRIVLAFLIVQDGLDNQFVRIVDSGNDARAERTEGIEAFCTGPLCEGRIFLDQLAGSNVI